MEEAKVVGCTSSKSLKAGFSNLWIKPSMTSKLTTHYKNLCNTK